MVEPLWNLVAAGWEAMADPTVLLSVVAAATAGVFIGAIPGLSATMAVALLVPITFFMPDVAAIAAIVSLTATTIFAGDIPTALVRIPGTPASAAYADDAYALTRRGLAHKALGASVVFSVVGGLFSAVVLMTAAPRLAAVATVFQTHDKFWLYVLGLSCAVIVSRGSTVKGALAIGIGLLLSTVGLSAVHSEPRFTFGQTELHAGVNFIPAMIGLFGVSEVLRLAISLGERRSGAADAASAAEGGAADQGGMGGGWGLSLLGEMFTRLVRRPIAAVRSAVVGVLTGMIPGAGADIAAWVSYAASKRYSKNPEEYGRGSLEGLSDATNANNAALAGSWVPALVFGVPGDSITAIVIGVLLMKNIVPGPDIFTAQPGLVGSIYLTFILANLLLIPIGLVAIRGAVWLVRIPRRLLLPAILLFCIVGSFAINGAYFDVLVMLAMGLVGFVLERYGVPLGPVVLGIILGGPLEENLVQSLTKTLGLGLGEQVGMFFYDAGHAQPIVRPILSVGVVLLWLWPVLTALLRRGMREGT